MIFDHCLRFPDIPGRFGMFPDDSGAFQIVFGAFRSCESPEKSDFVKNRRSKKCCWPKNNLLGIVRNGFGQSFGVIGVDFEG